MGEIDTFRSLFNWRGSMRRLNYLSKFQLKRRQRDESDCGAAALSSVATYYGVESSLGTLRYLSGTDPTGGSIKGLVAASKAIGLECGAFKGGLISLQKVPLPAILYLNREQSTGHFVVLYRVKRERFLIMDPADGEFRWIKVKQLQKEWSGAILLFQKEGEIKKMKFWRPSPSLLKVLTLMKKRVPLYLFTVIISLFSSLSIIATALIVKELFDRVLPNRELSSLFVLTALLGVLLLLSTLLKAFKSKLLIKRGVALERELTAEYFTHLSKIALPLFSSFTTGELTARVGEIFKIGRMVNETISQLLLSLITLLISTLLLSYLNSELVKVVLLFIPLYIALYLVIDRVAKPIIRKVMERGAQLQSALLEQFRAMESIKNFGVEERFLERSISLYSGVVDSVVESANLTIRGAAIAETFSKVVTIGVLWLGGRGVIEGSSTVGELIAFYTVTALFTTPLQQLIDSFWQIREGLIGAARYYDIMGIEREESRAFPFVVGKAPLEVKELTFGYSGAELLFNGLSFKLKRGEITLLRGESGSGKSTLASIIMGHLPPLKGTIGTDIEGVEGLDYWRRAVALVPQEPTIFGATLLEAILPFGVVEEKSDYLTVVVKELELDKMGERFPMGLLSHPGENGEALSRGEQQRLSYARGVMRESEILILDEPTVSLDEKCRELIVNSLKRLKREGRALLLISHEEWALQLADKVIELKSERGVESNLVEPMCSFSGEEMVNPTHR